MTAECFLLLVSLLALCAPAAGQKPLPAPTPSANVFLAARNFLAQGDLARARDATLAELKSAPDSVEGYDLLGIIYMQQRDYDAALKAFEHALTLNPRSAATHNNLANWYAQQQKTDLAEKEYRTTLRIAPGDQVANYNMGVLLLGKNQPDAAIPYFRKINRPDLSAGINLVRAYLRAHRTQTALAYARELSLKGSNDAGWHLALGKVLDEENQSEAAEHELEIADGLRPGNYEILLNEGKASLHAKHYEKADSALNRALLAKPDSVDALETLGRMYFDRNRLMDALQLLVKAHKLAPGNTDIIFLLARISMLESYDEDAIPLLEQGIKLAPQNLGLHAALGECYFQTGKTDKALAEFEGLRQIDPTATPYAFLSFCYRYLGRFDEAKKASLEGLKIDPHNLACVFNLGAVLNKQGNEAEAEKYLTEALKINPDFDEALLELASLKMSMKKYEEAIPLLRHAMTVSRDPGPAYYKLATAERNLHRTEDAQRDLKIFQTLSKSPNQVPMPYQSFFEMASRRESLPAKARLELDVKMVQDQVKRHPTDPEDLYMLAEAQLRLGRRDEVAATLGQLEEVSGQDLRTELEVGVLLARYRYYTDAVPHFERSLAADPNSDEARYDLADAYFHLRDYNRAYQVLQQVSAGGRDDSFLFLLGDVEARIGRTGEAVEIFRHALETNPDNDQYYLTLAMTYLRGGKTEDAERVLQQGLGRVPNSARIHWGLGVVSALKDDDHGAEANLVEATELMPQWVTAFSTLGYFYSQTGQISKARETLEKFKAVNGSGDLDASRIEHMLDQESAQQNPAGSNRPLSPEARAQFLQVALALADRDL